MVMTLMVVIALTMMINTILLRLRSTATESDLSSRRSCHFGIRWQRWPARVPPPAGLLRGVPALLKVGVSVEQGTRSYSVEVRPTSRDTGKAAPLLLWLAISMKPL